MDEGFPDLPRARRGGGGERVSIIEQSVRQASEGHKQEPSLLNQRRVSGAVEPPRPIPNRVVKRCSAVGTGGLTAGRQGPRAHQSCEC